MDLREMKRRVDGMEWNGVSERACVSDNGGAQMQDAGTQCRLQLLRQGL
jgi:hypothetical protein